MTLEPPLAQPAESHSGPRDPSRERPASPPGAVRGPEWLEVVSAGQRRRGHGELRLRRVVLQMLAAALVVGMIVTLGGSVLARRLAEKQSVHEVAQTTDVIGQSVVQPALTDAMATDTEAMRAGLDRIVRDRVLSAQLVRVKIWTADGTIRYSDDTRLVGRRFGLDDEAREAFSDPQTVAEVSDLNRPENLLDREVAGGHSLLEVYRPLWTPDGTEVLFEAYYRYDLVTDRSRDLARGFIGVTLSSVLIVFVLLVPVMLTLFNRARRSQQEQQAAMRRALDASELERQRIAAGLHDGLVQELTAASFAVAAGAQTAAGRGDADLSDQLDAAAATIRTGIGSLRSVVVDIYPQSLPAAGLARVLTDMAGTVAGRAVPAEVELDPAAVSDLDDEQQQAVFRIAQEALRNTVRHAHATSARISLARAEDTVRLEVSDDGDGFDPDVRKPGHLGTDLMAQVARSIGAALRLSTAPGAGTRWLLEIHR